MFIKYWTDYIKKTYGTIDKCNDPILIENIIRDCKKWNEINSNVLSTIDEEEKTVCEILTKDYSKMSNDLIKEIMIYHRNSVY